MRIRLSCRLGAALVMLVCVAGAQAQGAPKCDNACLKKLVDSYFVALVAHDPSRVPIAPAAKFVENVTPTKVGEGLWKTASEVPTTFKIYVPDPVAQQVGFIGVLKEQGKPIEIGLRLKLAADGKIAEIEHVVVHMLRDNVLDNLKTPRPAFLAAVPAGDRMSREDMLKDASRYYEAIVTSNGKAAPFASDCVRRENGIQTSGNPPPPQPGRETMGAMGCSDQLDTGVMSYIKRIEPRRVWIADVEHGLVFGLSQFRHPMKERVLKIVGVPGVDHQDMNFEPFDLPAAHVFKVQGGRIHEIEALGFMAPYNAKTGWE
ncbi:MAG: hypothetical protein WDO68_06495 [Gammaproteobacteria bacterium]